MEPSPEHVPWPRGTRSPAAPSKPPPVGSQTSFPRPASLDDPLPVQQLFTRAASREPDPAARAGVPASQRQPLGVRLQGRAALGLAAALPWLHLFVAVRGSARAGGEGPETTDERGAAFVYGLGIPPSEQIQQPGGRRSVAEERSPSQITPSSSSPAASRSVLPHRSISHP